MVVQVNMLEAKSQLSRLVKAALAGEEVIIASHGKPFSRRPSAALNQLPAQPLAALQLLPAHRLEQAAIRRVVIGVERQQPISRSCRAVAWRDGPWLEIPGC